MLKALRPASLSDVVFPRVRGHQEQIVTYDEDMEALIMRQ